MRWLTRLTFVFWLWIAGSPVVPAADFKMADGSVISGELVAPNDDGTVIRRRSGGLTSRLGWDKFAQETLIELAKDEKLKEVVQAFIDLPESALEAERPELVIKDPPGKVERPAKRPGLFSAFFGTPIGLFIVLLIFAGNLYAAHEVAVFRNYPSSAVVGTSVILPVLGPILFLCMPNRVDENVEVEGQFSAPQEVQNTGAQELAAAGLAGSGLALSAGQKAGASATTQPAVYKRGEVEFNRQFFERSFPQFFRMTRSEADRDLVLAVRSSKGEVVASRVTRISSSEIGLATLKGHEVQLRFGDIAEVQVRTKA